MPSRLSWRWPGFRYTAPPIGALVLAAAAAREVGSTGGPRDRSVIDDRKGSR